MSETEDVARLEARIAQLESELEFLRPLAGPMAELVSALLPYAGETTDESAPECLRRLLSELLQARTRVEELETVESFCRALAEESSSKAPQNAAELVALCEQRLTEDREAFVGVRNRAEARIAQLESELAEYKAALAELHEAVGRGPGHGTVKETLACAISGICDLRQANHEIAEEDKALTMRVDALESELAAGAEAGRLALIHNEQVIDGLQRRNLEIESELATLRITESTRIESLREIGLAVMSLIAVIDQDGGQAQRFEKLGESIERVQRVAVEKLAELATLREGADSALGELSDLLDESIGAPSPEALARILVARVRAAMSKLARPFSPAFMARLNEVEKGGTGG